MPVPAGDNKHFDACPLGNFRASNEEVDKVKVRLELKNRINDRGLEDKQKE
jgi:hypothetical protein